MALGSSTTHLAVRLECSKAAVLGAARLRPVPKSNIMHSKLAELGAAATGAWRLLVAVQVPNLPISALTARLAIPKLHIVSLSSIVAREDQLTRRDQRLELEHRPAGLQSQTRTPVDENPC